MKVIKIPSKISVKTILMANQEYLASLDKPSNTEPK